MKFLLLFTFAQMILMIICGEKRIKQDYLGIDFYNAHLRAFFASVVPSAMAPPPKRPFRIAFFASVSQSQWRYCPTASFAFLARSRS
jgi:hypothetical protein